LRALDRLPEVDIEAVFQIRSLLRRSGRLLRLMASEPLTENILEISGRCSRSRSTARASAPRPTRKCIGKIEPSKAHVRTLASSSAARASGHPVLRIEADLVIHRLLFVVAQDIVGFLNGLEFILGSLVAGVEVGMVFAR
jgi:hypothetical protein